MSPTKVIEINLLRGYWTHQLQTRLESTILRTRTSTGWSYPIRNCAIRQTPRMIRIFCEQYEREMLSHLSKLYHDISFPKFTYRLKTVKGWNSSTIVHSSDNQA